MNNKKQTSARAALKNLLIVPVAAFIFAAFSCEQTATKKLTESNIENQVPPPPPPPINGQSVAGEDIQSTGEKVFSKVDQMPVFPGGEKAMMKFIHDNLIYPESAKATGVQGTVFVNMVIDDKGKVANAKVLKGVPILGDEALRVLSLMPAWEPGKQDGRPVAVAYTIPFKFVLN